MTKTTFLFVAAFLAHSASAQNPELKVLASRGVQAAIEDLKPQAEKALGRKLAITFDSTTALNERISKGEAFDVTILTNEAIDALIKSGKLSAPTRAEIARCGVGVGVKAGAPKPDISTPEAFKQTLLNAKGLTWAKDGASRLFIADMLKTLGIEDQVKSKIVLEQGSPAAAAAVASGKADILMTLVSEILPAPGVQLVGPFPEKVQHYVNFAAAVNAQSTQASAAKDYIKALKNPSAVPVYKAKGIEAR